MTTGFGTIGFIFPWLLLGLLALPILWLFLRAVPPAPIVRRFPAVVLLFGLKDEGTTADRTPWWLVLLRISALAAAIVGFAGPVLNPSEQGKGAAPLLVVLDGSWASAQDWSQRSDRAEALLTEADLNARPTAVLRLTDRHPEEAVIAFGTARGWNARLTELEPRPWAPDFAGTAVWIAANEAQRFETIWLSDGLNHPDRADLLAALQAKGNVTVLQSGDSILALTLSGADAGALELSALRQVAGTGEAITVSAFGPDPNGVERELGRIAASFSPGARELPLRLELPGELRNRVRRLQIKDVSSAGATVLSDDTIQRRKVALLAGREAHEGQELVSPLHYLRKALVTTADLIEAPLADVLLAKPDVIILADVGRLTGLDAQNLLSWVERGGFLLRFAGPRMAASVPKRLEQDPLLPVRLRSGGRDLGGAMSWGAPKRLKPFEHGSLFEGLSVPDEVTVSSQVVAEPDPDLSAKVMAQLLDGTPLVTGEDRGKGRVVLVHVTANAEWSSLPLSGLFVSMLERMAVSTLGAARDGMDIAPLTWLPEQTLTGFGEVRDVSSVAGVDGKVLAAAKVGPDLWPGVYTAGERRLAVNVVPLDAQLSPAVWPARVTVLPMIARNQIPLKNILLTAALLLLLADILVTLWLGGRLRLARLIVPLIALVFFFIGAPADAEQNDQRAIEATTNTVLAYVLTGNIGIDQVSDAGMKGLSQSLYQRTSVEPIDPIGVDLEQDDLAFYPMLYWPIGEGQNRISDRGYEKINTYLRSGGMILFDTRDANFGGGLGGSTPNGRIFQRVAEQLDIPPLAPVPSDHVLTRSFYLLQDFPGRFMGEDVWVEAAQTGTEQIEGMPFRNLNDGVTPVVIGGNDWASAWAVDVRGQPMFPVGRGFAGERQREMAVRFGINLVMHVMTGNYKSDQVHVPALLERLGQ